MEIQNFEKTAGSFEVEFEILQKESVPVLDNLQMKMNTMEVVTLSYKRRGILWYFPEEP